jgi:hypothetical protein
MQVARTGQFHEGLVVIAGFTFAEMFFRQGPERQSRVRFGDVFFHAKITGENADHIAVQYRIILPERNAEDGPCAVASNARETD